MELELARKRWELIDWFDTEWHMLVQRKVQHRTSVYQKEKVAAVVPYHSQLFYCTIVIVRKLSLSPCIQIPVIVIATSLTYFAIITL